KEVAESTLRYLGVPPSLPPRTLVADAPMMAAFSQETNVPAPTANAPVPDLRGLDLRAAVARAVAGGLTVRVVGSGVVQTQSPEPGGALPENRELIIHLAEVSR